MDNGGKSGGKQKIESFEIRIFGSWAKGIV